MTLRTQANLVRRHLVRHLSILATIVVLLWLLELLDIILWHINLDAFGIRPRTLTGLRQIFLAPFLHVGFAHLIANTVPFFVLGWMVLIRRARDFYLVSLIAMLVSGLGIWSIAPAHTVHLGASGVVFGYLGYLWARAFFERSLPALTLAVIAGLLYGGLLWGLLPGQTGVSWQGHFFGFLGGILAAHWLAYNRPVHNQSGA